MWNAKRITSVMMTVLLVLLANAVMAQQQEGEWGDAPEGVLAYPLSGVIGQFPTCATVGPSLFVYHGPLGWAWFGPGVDFEMDGNAGTCPGFAPYDMDECFNDGDAGLLIPDSFTIVAGAVAPCPGAAGMPLGQTCAMANWGVEVDIYVSNNMPVDGFFNVLADWNQDGFWAPSNQSACSAPEHAVANFPIPMGFSGPVSLLTPPSFQIGGDLGHCWFRFSVTEQPVNLDWDGSGMFEDGETEDYLLQVIDDSPVETKTWSAVKGIYR